MTLSNRLFLAVCLVGLANIAAVFGQTPAPVPVTDVVLTVGGSVTTPLKLTAADLQNLPRKTVRATPHNGKEAEYVGVALREILQKAGVKFGEHMKGKALANYLLVEATDGYQAIFALPELDPAFTDKLVLLVDRQDGKPLDGNAGPLQIIVPDEKQHARWVRQVKALTVRCACD